MYFIIRANTIFICFLALILWAASPVSVAEEPMVVPELTGKVIQGGLIRGRLPVGSQPSIDGEQIEQNSEGYFVFGFGRDAAPEAVFSWRDALGQEQSMRLSVEQREYPTQYVEGVPQKTVTPDPSKLARIQNESRLVRESRAQLHHNDYFLSPFVIPLKGPVTGVYGSQRVYNGVPKRPHYGIDYAAPVGTPVVAPADAIVTLVHPDMYYSGGTLIMDHGFGLSSTFIHLSEILVEKGQLVKQGQAVAKVGAGGRASGPHLDWRINWFDTRIDPALVLNSPPVP